MTQLNISNYGSTTSQTLNDDDLELECISLLRKMKEKKKAGLLPLVGRSGPQGMDGDAGRIPALCAGISAPPAVQRDSSAAASARVFQLAVACGLCLTNPASPSPAGPCCRAFWYSCPAEWINLWRAYSQRRRSDAHMETAPPP